MTDNDFQQIEQYLAGKLTGKELQQFEQRLAADRTFYELVRAQQHIDDVLGDTFLVNFMQNLHEVAEAFHTEQAQATYTLDELLQLFGTHSENERQMAEVVRNRDATDSLQILSPPNGEDCMEQATFILAQAINEDLYLYIEDSKGETKNTYNWPANRTHFTIPTANLSPGRYYWKLFGEHYQTLVGYFFVQKDLNPW